MNLDLLGIPAVTERFFIFEGRLDSTGLAI